MHPLCMDAAEGGDTTFGTQRGVIFRLFRTGETDATIRKNPTTQKGTGAPCWNAGREEFRNHREKLVPTIFKSHASEPYVFLMTRPRRILHARLPYLFALGISASTISLLFILLDVMFVHIHSSYKHHACSGITFH